MELKDYQRRVIERFDEFLAALDREKQKAYKAVDALRSAGLEVPQGIDDWPKNAWDSMAALLPRTLSPTGLKIPKYSSRYDGQERSIPHACLKVPTGGGKTLLAAECVGRIKRDFFKKQTGLVLWVVPTVSIYTQTKKALLNREHPYRQSLERASGGRVKIFEKDDAFNKADTDNYLCIMLVRLAATNRKNNKEFLKIFRDAGRYTSFFPDSDDYAGNNALLAENPDLEALDLVDSASFSGVTIKQSLVNTFKLLRPVIVIDEGHKAYSDNTRDSLNAFNPSFILELTATPNTKHHISNVLVDVSGLDLKDEQMIKLPINIINTHKGDWKHTLTMAHERLGLLNQDAESLQAKDGRYIRPIMVITVENTGKAQKSKATIHAEDAKTYLIERLSVKEEEIRIKSSEKDELGEDDLFDPTCPVKYIITKEALQEGWDCFFAYVLTLLDKKKAQTAMTQMVGRVLRQPDARTTSIETLNQCYIFSYDQEVKTAVSNVQKGLENEGMSGISHFVKIDETSLNNLPSHDKKQAKINRRNSFKGLEIFLPKVLHQDKNGWRDLSYDTDILSAISWEDVTYDPADFIKGADRLAVSETKIDVYQKLATDNSQGAFTLDVQTSKHSISSKKDIDLAFLTRPLLDVFPNPWQASRVLLSAIDQLKSNGLSDHDIYDSRLYLVESIKRQVKKTVHVEAESIFKEKLSKGEITFKLMTNGNQQLNFEIAQELKSLIADNEKKLFKETGEKVENSLFEIVFEKDLNNLERDFALYLSDTDSIKWWHRIVESQRDTSYSLQGWQKNKIYPDFVACTKGKKLLVLETKGLHLKGNDDTIYKQRLFNMLTEHYNTIHAGEVALQNSDTQKVSLEMLIEDNWQNQLESVLNL